MKEILTVEYTQKIESPYYCHCAKKPGFRTRTETNEIIRRIHARPTFVPNPEVDIIPYMCDECGYWHVGKTAILNAGMKVRVS